MCLLELTDIDGCQRNMAKHEDVVQPANYSGSMSNDAFQLLGWYRGEEKGWNRIARYPEWLRIRS